jgi:fluoroquinolone transport system permease protein
MKNNRLLLLIQGEFQRFNKYGVTTISFMVAVVWFLMLYFLDNQLLDQMLPVIILMDTTMMAVLFIGATMFFEKSESTISTLLVTPIRPAEIIGSKVIANAIHTLFATMLVVVVFYFTRGLNVQYFYMVIVLLIVSSFHTLLGLVFSYMSKDFTSMLVNTMIYTFILVIPTLLVSFGVLRGDLWSWLLRLTPTTAAETLIQVAFGADMDGWFWYSLFYFVGIGALGYRYYVLPKFKQYAIKQSGV